MSRVIIVDDFYTDPDAVYNNLMRVTVDDSQKGNYAGVMTADPFWVDSHQESLWQLTGQRLESATVLNGKFRFSCASDQSKQHIHFDPGNDCVWAGVCYLQKPEFYQTYTGAGTKFWQHKRTGLSSIPLTLEGISIHGWHTVNDLKLFLETDGLDESLWEMTLEVPYRYNRLVLFRPWMFHSPGCAFGTDKTNCRIVQTFFLKDITV